MEELIEKVLELKKSLDENVDVKEIKELKEKIGEDKELLSLIEKYKYNRKESLKEKIYNNPLYKIFKEKETDINILILEINNSLKKINSKGKCHI